MTVSAMYPSAALPGAVPTAATAVAGASPLAGYGTAMPATSALTSALNGAQTASPNYGANISSTAMQAAIQQLKSAGVSDADINQQLLAMQAQAGAGVPSAAGSVAAPTAAVTAHKATVAAKKKATVKKPTTAKAKAAAAAKTKAAKAKAVAAAKAKAAAATVGTAGAVGTQLPANATALPGGTVYSYADANNPGLAGLAGLTPQQQLQLGIMPNGLANGLGVEPQSNITNQSNVNPAGLLGMTGLTGLAGIGGVPTLGSPIIGGNTNLSKPATSTTTGAPGAPTTGTTPGSQTVANRNTNDNGSFSQGVDPYGAMYGGYGGYGGMGYGVGTMPYAPYNTGIAGGLYSPYGASMQGAAYTGTTNSGGIMGWLGRLFN